MHQQFAPHRINALMRDEDHNLWFSTSNGIIMISQKAQNLTYISNDDASLRISDITTLKSGKIALMGKYALYQYDPQCHCATEFLPQLHQPYNLVEDDDNNLWIATIGNGVTFYSQKHKTMQQLKNNEADGIIRTNYISQVFIDNKQQAWIAPFIDLPLSNGGLYRFDLQQRSYQTFLETPWITSITQIGEDELLLTSDLIGLITLNTRTGKTTEWRDTIPSTPLRVRMLFFDSQNNLWVGTRGQGLAYFDRSNNEFVFYNAESGLLSDNIFSIVEDNERNLWLGTKVGLSRFNPQTQAVMNLEQQDGLLFPNFSLRASNKLNDGKLMFGAQQGMMILDPNDFKTKSHFPKVVINEFRLLNRPVQISSVEQPSPLEQTIEFTEQLVLSHLDDVFSFGFSALEYNRPDKIRFAYKMEGLNDDWQYTDGSNRIASYTTLAAGQYVFKVKASNAQGQWRDEVTSIVVEILPPWWLTLPAYLIYIMVFVGTVYLYIRVRTDKLMHQAKLLEQRVDERTQQLQQSHQQLAEQSQAVSKLLGEKQRLFSSISHEFRTPLTLILSPVDQLLSSDKGKPVNAELNLIKRSGRRLLRMVDQLLEFARLEQHSHDDADLTPVSLAQTISIITASFEGLLAAKKLTLTVDPFVDVTLNVLPDSLNKILLNLVSNAIKYTGHNGKIELSVNVEGDKVEIVVRDNGFGIDKNDHQSIFERFNRALHENDESISGAGIGLALVKELAEANRGSISVQSVLNQGSTFTLTLPVDVTEPLTSDKLPVQQVLKEQMALEIDSITTPDSEPDEAAVEHNNEQQKSILIIDDNADIRQLLCTQLSSQYQCSQAANGQAGLTLAKEQLPDLIISDVMMPVMDGYDLAQALKNDELTSHIPIILLTAKGSLESRIKGLQMLVDDYLAKPFNIEELTLRISNILTIRDIVRKRWGQAIDSNEAHNKPGNKPSEILEQLGLNTLEQAFLDKVNNQLSEHYKEDELNSQSLSELLLISEKQLQRKIRALLDVSIPELVSHYRLNKAVELLDDGHRA
ncbi:MAG: response regulator, partial [Algicola sp.]|nr:response regulator [Algicola sp.]